MNSKRHDLAGSGFYKLALPLGLVLFCGSAAWAQPVLSLTMGEAGNFLVFPGGGVGGGCSQWSPQNSNSTSNDWNTGKAFGVPGYCQNMISLFVANTGKSPTNGPISINDTIVSYMPRAVTVLGAYSGSVTFPGQPAVNWACAVSPGFNEYDCTTNDSLAPGEVTQVNVVVLVEDYARYGMNNLATVSGGGSAPAYAFDSQIQWPSAAILPQTLITIHSLPEGLTAIVDGVKITTPHTYTWTTGDQHSITSDGPATGVGYNGITPVTPQNYIVTGMFYGFVNFVYAKP